MRNYTTASLLQPISSSGWTSPGRTSLLTAVIVGAASIWILRFLQYRWSYYKLGPQLKQPPFNTAFGTLKAMAIIYQNCPVTCHPQVVMTLLQRKFGLGNVWHLDTWPAAPERHLIFADPTICASILQQPKCLDKHKALRVYVEHICGKTSLLFGPADATWKKRRALFNPGFALSHLMTMTPTIVDDVSIFCDILGEIADAGKIVPLEELAARVTIDIMGHVVLDHDLNSQRTKNELVEAFRHAIDWTPSFITSNPLVSLNPLRPIMQRYYAKKMDDYIARVLDNRYAASNGQPEVTKGRKPAIDLAVDEYARQQEDANMEKSSHGMDKEFKRVVLDQMRTFIFAGHDTSSSTICYAYHLLNLHPASLAKAREECDDVFGKHTSGREVGEQFKENPSLANQLPYTLAVIKETLRMFPPSTPAREGSEDMVVNYNGETYPTKGFLVMMSTHTLHRRPDLFPSPDEFIPERFMPAPNNFQDVPKDAWRPFEKGPRACIGQELALLEMKILMAMTIRDFDIKAEYEEWDRMLGREKPGETLDGRRGILGERAFQILIATAKPVDGLPASVKRRKP